MSSVSGNHPHRLECDVLIHAPREVVFAFFTDSARWATWWGPGSAIDSRVGGPVVIRYPNGVEARGQIIEIQPPSRLSFTYGYVSGSPIAPGGSQVDIVLTEEGDSTRLHLSHAFDSATAQDEHVQGWRYQLSVFANVVGDEVFASVDDCIEGWFGAWAAADDGHRARVLGRVALPTVHFRDRFGTIEGVNELAAHIAAVHRFRPGVTLQRIGSVRRCQNMALADWSARGAGGEARGSGSIVFVFSSSGYIASATGFWSQIA